MRRSGCVDEFGLCVLFEDYFLDPESGGDGFFLSRDICSGHQPLKMSPGWLRRPFLGLFYEVTLAACGFQIKCADVIHSRIR